MLNCKRVAFTSIIATEAIITKIKKRKLFTVINFRIISN